MSPAELSETEVLVREAEVLRKLKEVASPEEHDRINAQIKFLLEKAWNAIKIRL